MINHHTGPRIANWVGQTLSSPLKHKPAEMHRKKVTCTSPKRKAVKANLNSSLVLAALFPWTRGVFIYCLNSFEEMS